MGPIGMLGQRSLFLKPKGKRLFCLRVSPYANVRVDTPEGANVLSSASVSCPLRQWALAMRPLPQRFLLSGKLVLIRLFVRNSSYVVGREWLANVIGLAHYVSSSLLVSSYVGLRCSEAAVIPVRFRRYLDEMFMMI